jgi:YVTN family beta-propeller protein
MLPRTVTMVTFRILGRFEALVDGRPLDLLRRRERALLGVLLLNLGEVVSVDALIDSVWGERAPASARHLVHEYVSRIRGAFGDGSLIATRAPGYVVERDACELDAALFGKLVREARSAVAVDDLADALKAFDEALALWRGDTLSDVALEGDARSAATSLDGQRRAAQSERVDVALALGQHHRLIPELDRAVAAEPLDERLRRQLMLALYRDGRQADALERYREGRRTLVDQVGIEPGAELRALEQAILRHDPALTLPSAAGSSAANDETSPPASRRRIGLAAAAALVVIAGLATIAAFAARKAPSTTAPIRGDAVAVVDATHARLLGSVPVIGPPGAIAYGAGAVWVSSPDARTVLRISPESRRVIASVPLGVAAQSLAVAGSSVWAVGSGPNDEFLTLERIDPTFASASIVRRLPVVATGDRASLSARGGNLLVAPSLGGLLTRIDARDGRILRQVDPNAAPSAAALGFGSSWLVYTEADLVVRVDSSGAITQIPVGREPSAIAVGKHAVWVANALDGTVKSIDPATASTITTVRVGSAPAAIAEDGGSIWVANAGDGTLTRIDEGTGRPSARVTVGGSPQSLVVADGKVWASVQPPAPAQPSGGTVVVGAPSYVTNLDPQVQFNGAVSDVLYPTCAMLLNYPDEPGAGGLHVVPDAARSLPGVSKDGRTYTFTIRSGMRFSPPSNQPVSAQTFKYTIERSLSPHLGDGEPPGQMFLQDVVGAPAYIAGKVRHIAGIEARGNRLTIHLTDRAPDLPARLASIVFCAVPTDTPMRPVSAPIPSAGPYYVASETPRRGFVLLRNPNYHGDRPHRPQRIEIVVGGPHPIARIEAGKLDYAIGASIPAGESGRLERLYGAHSAAARRGQQRYFVNRSLGVDFLDVNTRRPLFASARVRRAASYAIDRSALAATGGSFSTAAAPAEMSLPRGIPGFRNRHLYPLTPDLAKARRLAGGGHHDAVIYCVHQAPNPQAAQIVKNNLAAIGIDVHIHCVSGGEMWTLLGRPNEPWDLAVDTGGPTYADPSSVIHTFAATDWFNFSHYHNARLNQRIRAAERLSGVPRAQAYAGLDLTLTRDIVPWITFDNPIAQDFFSARIGCQVEQPMYGMDLAALCIRPSGRRRS